MERERRLGAFGGGAAGAAGAAVCLFPWPKKNKDFIFDFFLDENVCEPPGAEGAEGGVQPFNVLSEVLEQVAVELVTVCKDSVI